MTSFEQKSAIALLDGLVIYAVLDGSFTEQVFVDARAEILRRMGWGTPADPVPGKSPLDEEGRRCPECPYSGGDSA